MYIRKRTEHTTLLRCWGTACVLALSLSLFLAGSAPLHFTSSRGLELVVIKNPHIDFVHAQLMIHYPPGTGNPALPYLTYMNIFDPEINETDTQLLSILRKLGNDYEVEHQPDYLLFKINFLPDQVPLFIRFLKALYAYRPFLEASERGGGYAEEKKDRTTRERFKDSVANYWKYFFKRKDWRTRIAYQVAYNHLFLSGKLGNTLVTPRHVKTVNFDHIRAFYGNAYQLPNSRLVLKGKLRNPAIVHGLIERTFSSFEKDTPHRFKPGKVMVNDQEKIIIFNINSDEAPSVYWFETVATARTRPPLPQLVLNSILFGYPTGRILLNANGSRLSTTRFKTEMSNHHGVSVIVNSIRVRNRDVEKMIMLVNREQKKMHLKRVEKREYLTHLSTIYRQLDVNTRDFRHDVNVEIVDNEYYNPDRHYNRNITLAGLNSVVEDFDHSVVIIVGNARHILPNASALRSRIQVIDFNRPGQ